MPPAAYHHGDLPNALRAAAAELLAAEGAAGFSLREVARRAGVSHTAPAHHFGDARGLLTSLAVEGFRYLAQRTTEAAAAHDDAVEQLVAIGRCYVETALTHPGHCEVLFRTDLVDGDSPEYQAAGEAALAVLRDTVRALAEARNPHLDVDLATHLCWSAMQGLVDLRVPMARIAERNDLALPDLGTTAETFTRLMIDGLAPGR